jgi:hypothetical protein
VSSALGVVGSYVAETPRAVERRSVVLVSLFEEPGDAAKLFDDRVGLDGAERRGRPRGEVVELCQCCAFLSRGFGSPRMCPRLTAIEAPIAPGH